MYCRVSKRTNFPHKHYAPCCCAQAPHYEEVLRRGDITLCSLTSTLEGSVQLQVSAVLSRERNPIAIMGLRAALEVVMER
jgi:hypothetical protein